jgi:hypothetical protein
VTQFTVTWPVKKAMHPCVCVCVGGGGACLEVLWCLEVLRWCFEVLWCLEWCSEVPRCFGSAVLFWKCCSVLEVLRCLELLWRLEVLWCLEAL